MSFLQHVCFLLLEYLPLTLSPSCQLLSFLFLFIVRLRGCCEQTPSDIPQQLLLRNLSLLCSEYQHRPTEAVCTPPSQHQPHFTLPSLQLCLSQQNSCSSCCCTYSHQPQYHKNVLQRALLGRSFTQHWCQSTGITMPHSQQITLWTCPGCSTVTHCSWGSLVTTP